MGEKIEKRLTIVEGREMNKNMAQQLVDAAKAAGFSTRWIRKIDESKIAEGKLDEVFSDMILWRSPTGYTSAEAIERVEYWVNKNRKITINTHSAGGRMYNSNKFFQHEMFMSDPITRPCTLPCYPAFSKKFILKLIKDKRIDYPFVLKPNLGSRGEGIKLIRNEDELMKFNGTYSIYSVEKFVSSKYDWRVFVLGGVALGVMKKLGNEDNPADFIAKSAGKKRWSEEDLDLAEEVKNIAIQASMTCGLEYSGVDLIRDDETGQFVLLETNVAGGWQNGFYEATGVDVPTKIMEWFLDRMELFNGTVYNAVSKYVSRRLELLSRGAQAKYKEILEFSYKPEVLDLSQAKTLEEKLRSAYIMIQKPDLSEVEKIRISDLISAVENYEISGYGNFIGKDSGSLEESLERTALYLAISSKM